MKESATIDGFTVELETMSDPSDPGRGEWVDCWVSQGRHSASLGLLEDLGMIEVDGGQDIYVPLVTIGRIRTWAARYGYE